MIDFWKVTILLNSLFRTFQIIVDLHFSLSSLFIRLVAQLIENFDGQSHLLPIFIFSSQTLLLNNLKSNFYLLYQALDTVLNKLKRNQFYEPRCFCSWPLLLFLCCCWSLFKTKHYLCHCAAEKLTVYMHVIDYPMISLRVCYLDITTNGLV